MKYDVAVVGGGMVGAMFALALAKQTSLSIVVLDAQNEASTWSKENYHHRVSAITLASQQLFKSIGVWDALKAKRVSPFEKIAVWDEENNNKNINFDSADIAQSLLGFIIENNAMQEVLIEALKQQDNIDYIAPIKLLNFIEHEDSIELTTDTNKIIKAACAVAADGAQSWLRSQTNIQINKNNYEQQAIVTTVKTILPHERIARQVFLKSGPLAFLPLDEVNTSSIVWSVPTEKVSELMGLNNSEFNHALTNAFSMRLGEVVESAKRYHFPLSMQQASDYVAGKVVLLGDAAHVMHPLAGQGVNVGLLDAASLAEVMVDAIANNRSFAAPLTLRRYERWRRADNANLLLGVDLIKKFFASEKPAIKQIRSLGLTTVERIALLKNIFTRHAVGDRSDLPRMAKLINS